MGTQQRFDLSTSKGLPGVGFSRPQWEPIKPMKSGSISRTIMDDTLPGGPRERTIVYQAPFDRCDRERDYETAWADFERRFKLSESDTPGEAGGLMSWAASKAVVRLHNHQFQYGV